MRGHMVVDTGLDIHQDTTGKGLDSLDHMVQDMVPVLDTWVAVKDGTREAFTNHNNQG